MDKEVVVQEEGEHYKEKSKRVSLLQLVSYYKIIACTNRTEYCVIILMIVSRGISGAPWVLTITAQYQYLGCMYCKSSLCGLLEYLNRGSYQHSHSVLCQFYY